ncbi:MAG: hypothetical protein ACI4SH_07815 [Candidatus Scatosoma sp.]
MKMERVNKLNKEGKTYNLFYNEKAVANITLEAGAILTKETAFEIINQIFIEQGFKPRKYIEKVSFCEAPIEKD